MLKRNTSAGRQNKKIPFATRIGSGRRSASSRGSTADNLSKSMPAQPKKIPDHKASSGDLNQSMDDERSWRQGSSGVDDRVRKALEVDTDFPLQLRIDDSDALDFDTYKNSLFEDPFDFHSSTLPPSSPGSTTDASSNMTTGRRSVDLSDSDWGGGGDEGRESVDPRPTNGQGRRRRGRTEMRGNDDRRRNGNGGGGTGNGGGGNGGGNGNFRLPQSKSLRVVRWHTSDANGDQLRYRLYLRGQDQKHWKLVEED